MQGSEYYGTLLHTFPQAEGMGTNARGGVSWDPSIGMTRGAPRSAFEDQLPAGKRGTPASGGVRPVIG